MSFTFESIRRAIDGAKRTTGCNAKLDDMTVFLYPPREACATCRTLASETYPVLVGHLQPGEYLICCFRDGNGQLVSRQIDSIDRYNDIMREWHGHTTMIWGALDKDTVDRLRQTIPPSDAHGHRD